MLAYPATPEWVRRERARFRRGEYKPLPWDLEGWWAALTQEGGPCALHFAHVSREDPSQLAFTPDERKGEADRQTRMRPGRYLTRFASHVLSADEIRNWAGRYAAENETAELHIARTADEIQDIYQRGPSSCMSHGPSHYSSPVHPVRAYAAGDIELAYIVCDGRVTGRALVVPSKMVHTRIYGDADRMRAALETAGYTYSDCALKGSRLARIPVGDDGFVCPYIDYHSTVKDTGEFLVIDAGDSLYECQFTDGLTRDVTRDVTRGERCARCEDVFDSDSDSLEFYECYGGALCESCSSDVISFCEECETYCMSDDTRYVENGHRSGRDGITICDSCLDASFTECGESDCDRFERDENRVEIAGGGYVCRPCAENYVPCETCSDLHAPDSDHITHTDDGPSYCADCGVPEEPINANVTDTDCASEAGAEAPPATTDGTPRAA